MSGDILAAIDQAVAEHERCPCGNDLPADCPSFYWCSEACQAAWNLHQHDPARHAHPRDLRENRERLLAEDSRVVMPRPPQHAPREARTPLPELPFWAPADPETAAICAYTRWCATCRRKVPPVTTSDPGATTAPAPHGLLDVRPDVQTCPECQNRWAGRPLIGAVERYQGPGFRGLIRLRLSDGYRSGVQVISQHQLEVWRNPQACLALLWEHLEKMLCGGITDRQRQEVAGRHLRGRDMAWDWCVDLMAELSVIRPEDATRITGGEL